MKVLFPLKDKLIIIESKNRVKIIYDFPILRLRNLYIRGIHK